MPMCGDGAARSSLSASSRQNGRFEFLWQTDSACTKVRFHAPSHLPILKYMFIIYETLEVRAARRLALYIYVIIGRMANIHACTGGCGGCGSGSKWLNLRESPITGTGTGFRVKKKSKQLKLRPQQTNISGSVKRACDHEKVQILRIQTIILISWKRGSTSKTIAIFFRFKEMKGLCCSSNW